MTCVHRQGLSSGPTFRNRRTVLVSAHERKAEKMQNRPDQRIVELLPFHLHVGLEKSIGTLLSLMTPPVQLGVGPHIDRRQTSRPLKSANR